MKDQEKELNDKKYLAGRYGIPIEDIVWHNSGCCYDRIVVRTKESADKVAAAVKGGTVNGGMFHGMALGGISKTAEGHFDVMC